MSSHHTLIDAVTRQLKAELHQRIYPLAVLASIDATNDWPHQLNQRAAMLAAQLCDDDDHLAAESVIDVMNALWPTTEPPAQWWTTPIGRVAARSFGRDETEAVTHSVAAAMLGVTRGTIAQLVHRGKLDRHPDGGVLRASVLQRIADQTR